MFKRKAVPNLFKNNFKKQEVSKVLFFVCASPKVNAVFYEK